MATSVSVPASGNPDVDALREGSRWNSHQITYSFPTAASAYPANGDPDRASFQPIIPQLQARVRAALATISSVANITFTEVTETSSTHADIRFGMADISQESGLSLAGLGWSPNDQFSGDVWLQTGIPEFSIPQFQPSDFVLPTGDGFLAVMHEIGHALGLQHAAGLLPAAHDRLDYSIMDFRLFPGEALPTSDTPHFVPETPMIADVEALQYLYGANFSTNNTDTIYTWDRDTGQEFINGIPQDHTEEHGIYMTLWDGGGTDTFDFSNFRSDVSVDLRPGHFSSPSPLLLPTLNDASHTVFAEGSIANPLLFNGDSRSLIENASGVLSLATMRTIHSEGCSETTLSSIPAGMTRSSAAGCSRTAILPIFPYRPLE